MKSRVTSFAHGELDCTDVTVPSIINDDMKRIRTCVHCHQSYREFENIGAWRCQGHAAPWDPDRKWYVCCETAGKGCQACDHYENELVPYPGGTPEDSRWQQLVRGMPVFQLLEGNLKELHGVWEEAIQRAPWATGGQQTAVVYVYRRCLLGTPDLTVK